jgi:hypothetical protein
MDVQTKVGFAKERAGALGSGNDENGRLNGKIGLCNNIQERLTTQFLFKRQWEI